MVQIMNREIFIIDDDAIFRMIVSRAISSISPDTTIYECENGAIGLTNLKKQLISNQKLIVFLDINMPVVDGWQFLQDIKNNHLDEIPQLLIYIVSSSTDESDLLKAKEYNFVKGFLHKPLYKEVLNSILKIV
jgi:CheY-like chemotaxis protein